MSSGGPPRRKQTDPSASDEKLGAWDFFYVTKGTEHGTIGFPEGGTLLAVTMH